jgi:hypothetical protein
VTAIVGPGLPEPSDQVEGSDSPLLAGLPPLLPAPADRSAKQEGGPEPPATASTSVLPLAEEGGGGGSGDGKSAAQGPLQVLAVDPVRDPVDGTVSALVVRFSHPMIGPDDVGQLGDAPVRVEPAVPGHVRWLTASTAAFEPDTPGGRLPQATRYRIRVPAGTQAAGGAALAKAVQLEVATSSPTLLRHQPAQGEVVAADAPADAVTLSLTFDQPVDGAQVLKLARLERIAGPAQAHVIALALSGRDQATVRLRPVAGLAAGSLYRFTLAGGLPSLEGPLRSSASSSFEFRTRDPLRLLAVECDPAIPGTTAPAGEALCPAGDRWRLRFSAALAAAPALQVRADDGTVLGSDALRIEVAGEALLVHPVAGRLRRGQRYRLEVAAGLRAASGQHLVQPVAATVRIDRPRPRLGLALVPPADRQSGPRLGLTAAGIERVRLGLAAIDPAELPALLAAVRQGTAVTPRGLVERALTIAGGRDGEQHQTVRLPEPPPGASGRSRGSVARGLYYAAAAGPGATPVRKVLAAGPLELAVHAGGRGLVALVSRHGLPVGNAEVRLVDGGKPVWTARSDASGLIDQTLPAGSGATVLIAEHRGEATYVEPGNLTARDASEPPAPLLKVATDRRHYRAGETVQFHGTVLPASAGTATRPGHRAAPVLRWSLSGTGGRVAAGEVTTSAHGLFHGSVRLPENAIAGVYRLQAELAGPDAPAAATGLATNELTVEAESPGQVVELELGPGPAIVGRSLSARIQARYGFGEPLDGARVRWRWRRQAGGEVVAQAEGRLDGAGQLAVQLPLPAAPATAGPADRFVLEAEVEGPGGRPERATLPLEVFPSDVALELRPERQVVTAGSPVPVTVVVRKAPGTSPPVRRISVEAVELASAAAPTGGGQGPVAACQLDGGAGAFSCPLVLPRPGRYQLTATARDADGRTARAVAPVDAIGSDGHGWTPRELAGVETLELVPDRQRYRHGERARVLVVSPFADARGFMVVDRTLVRPVSAGPGAQVFTLELPAQPPPRSGHHELFVQLVGPAGAHDGGGAISPGARRAQGRLLLDVEPPPPLQVELMKPPSRAAAGGHLDLDVTVRQAGRPAPAQLVVSLVEEDPDLAPGAVTRASSRPVLLRTAAFGADLATARDGRAHLHLPLADRIGRFTLQVTAHTADGHEGRTMGAVELEKPLRVTPLWPAQVHYGDRLELETEVQNRSDQAGTVELVARSLGLRFESPVRQRFALAAGESRRVALAVQSVRPEHARLQIAARLDPAGTVVALERGLAVSLPVRVDTRVAHGQLPASTGPTTIGLQSPPPGQPIVEGLSGLELELFALPDEELAPALGALLAPGGGGLLRDRASRVLALATLEPRLAPREPGAGASRRPPRPLIARLPTAITELLGLLRADGSFAPWPGATERRPELDAYAGLALALAQRAGEPLEANAWGRLLGRLDAVADTATPEARALALFALERAGRPVLERVRRLLAAPGTLPLPARAWLLAAVAPQPPATAERARLVAELARAATGASGHLGGAAVLWALALAGAEEPLQAELARSLLAARRAGRWATAEENAVAVASLEQHFRAGQTSAAPVGLRAWGEGHFLGERRVSSRHPLASFTLPASAAAAGPLVLERAGGGALRYRATLRLLPHRADFPARPGPQLSVLRAYEPVVTGRGDVRRVPDGWQIRQGALVRVRLTVIASAPASQIQLTDALPTGLVALPLELEPVPPVGFESAAPPKLHHGPSHYRTRPFVRQPGEPGRVRFFAPALPAGIAEVTFLARATWAGYQLAPAAEAVPLPAPAKLALTSTDRLVITSGSSF